MNCNQLVPFDATLPTARDFGTGSDTDVGGVHRYSVKTKPVRAFGSSNKWKNLSAWAVGPLPASLYKMVQNLIDIVGRPKPQT